MRNAIKPTIVVHGGAGSWSSSGSKLDQAILDCRAAASVGQQVLLAGGSALDAVEESIRVLEDSPVLDAGRGSYFNTGGEIEMDALIMDGATLNLGAIASVQLVLHPISLARKVMTDCDHNLLVGQGAEKFADDIGFPRCSFIDLLDDEMRSKVLSDGSGVIEIQPAIDAIGDTVGAVALDSTGSLASGTSTGGTKGKRPGRVGDSPLVGSGGYADNLQAAVSATGQGEALMKVLISKRVCDFVGEGLSAQKACDAAINELHKRVQGEGGLIAVDGRGRIGVAFNTTAMPHAYAVATDDIVASAYLVAAAESVAGK